MTQPGATPVYHLYVIETDRRDALKAALNEAEISTDIHYPLPSHLQQACTDLGLGEGSLPVTERLSRQVLSLPMYPELPIEHVEYVAAKVSELAARLGAPVRLHAARE